MLNPWQGKLWRMYQVACHADNCHIEDQVGSHLWQPTAKEAAQHFHSHGWRKRGSKWYCREHAQA